MKAAVAMNDNFVRAAQPGAWLVDSLPFLKMLPAFMAPFKRKAEEFWTFETNLHLANLREASQRDGWSWSKDLSSAKEAKGMPEVELAWDVGVLADAAIETSAVFLEVFLFACVAYPEFVTVAQKEMDNVVSSEDGLRMPAFSDLENLPYVHAIVEEVFRWRHIIPAGIAHANQKDDWYNGFFIPKGSTIVPVWKAMHEDGKLYDAPLEFRPERWIGKTGLTNNWGYGRRVCVGRHIAKNTVAIAIARMLWAFNMRPADGKRVLFDETLFTGGMVSHPKRFDVLFEPRSEAHTMAIESAYESVDKDPESLMAGVRKAQVEMGLKPRA